MRDLISKALKMGFVVSFAEENGFSIIRLLKNGEVILNCSVGSGTFTESAEDSLQGLLLEAERRSL